LPSVRRLALLLLIFGCDPYRDGERLLVHSDPKAAASAIHPKDERGHKLRAQALLAAHEPAEARIEIRFAIALKPKDPEAWALLGRIERELGHPGLALVAMERAAQRDPYREPYRGDFEPLLAELRGKRDERLAQLRTRKDNLAMGEAPAITSARNWAKQGAHQRAIEAIVDWVGEDPALHARGFEGVRALDEIGDRDAAIELAANLVAEQPSDYEAHLELAHLYLGVGRQGRAEQEIDEAIYVASDRPLAMRRAAEILEKTGRRRAACSMLSRALAFGVQAEGLRAVGECLQRDGQTEQAQAILDRACAMDPACQAAGTGSTPKTPRP
jgi:Tfp pilus assembly protein PilF